MEQERQAHIKNGLEILEHEINLYKNDKDYHNDHFLGEMLERFKVVSKEMKELHEWQEFHNQLKREETAKPILEKENLI